MKKGGAYAIYAGRVRRIEGGSHSHCIYGRQEDRGRGILLVWRVRFLSDMSFDWDTQCFMMCGGNK